MFSYKKMQSAFDKKKLSSMSKNTGMYFGLAFAVLAGTIGFHTVPNTMKLQETKASILVEQDKQEELEKTFEEKVKEKEVAEAELLMYQDELLDDLAKVLPSEVEKHKLTQFFEDFTLQLAKQGKMEFTSVTFGSPKEVTEEYGAIPVSFSFTSNHKNFATFLDTIVHSGELNEQYYFRGEPIRIMSIENISFNIPETVYDEAGNEEPSFSVSMKLRAYYRIGEMPGSQKQ